MEPQQFLELWTCQRGVQHLAILGQRVCDCDGVARAGLTQQWMQLHSLALAGFTREQFEAWTLTTLRLLSHCDCREHWEKFIELFPPPLDEPERQFHWACFAHNAVNNRIGKPRYTLAQAYSIHRRKGEYENDVCYLQDNCVDVVIPYCDADKKFVSDAIQSVLDSAFVRPTIHVVYDSAAEGAGSGLTLTLTELKRHSTIKHYKTTHRNGPYRIANLIAAEHAKHRYMALLDADDVSTPGRLWRQLATLQRYGYQMTSGSMVNFVDTDDEGNAPLELRKQNEWVIESGVSFSHVPHGRCVNSVRTMLRSMFLDMRGFTDAICSVDFDFDNRAHYAGVPVFWGTDIVGRRRLHSRSLTNGPEFAHASANRQRSNQLVRDNLAKLKADSTVATAQRMGGLNRDMGTPGLDL